jgi:hypothetical protein
MRMMWCKGTSNYCCSSSSCLVAWHELGGVVPGVVACGVGQVLVQVLNGTLQQQQQQ